jgi:hypothetical protein
MTLSPDDRTRLLDSKAKHENEMRLSQPPQTVRLGQEMIWAISFEAGVKWASKTASYAELLSLCATGSIASITDKSYVSGVDFDLFYNGAESVYEELMGHRFSRHPASPVPVSS